MSEFPFFQALADACNADSDERIDKFMGILCTRSFPHLRKGSAFFPTKYPVLSVLKENRHSVEKSVFEDLKF